MFNKLIMWIFSKTAFGRATSGYKTELGYLLLVLSTIAKLLEAGAAIFPNVPVLATIAIALNAFNETIGKVIFGAGVVTMTTGVAHDKVKREVGAKV